MQDSATKISKKTGFPPKKSPKKVSSAGSEMPQGFAERDLGIPNSGEFGYRWVRILSN
jgi:hypothetical protein